MRKRYLPFGYQIEQGEIAIVSKESNAVRFIFEEYLAGKSLKEIADIMSAKDMLHKAMPERKNLMLITLTAGAHLDGITEFELPQCSRAEYKRHIKALRQMQHTDPTPYIRQVATKGIELIREVCPIQ